ncbi:MAG: carbon storage regulator [Proteobacteria bacterium]|nr:carbon storage regulator [Pseudomonadota bacterium]
MLVLTRKERESITIKTNSGETIRVTISSIRGDTVRIGFTAPRDVHIYRSELPDRPTP